MSHKPYLVEMIVNAAQPCLASWPFDTLSEAQDFLRRLQPGSTDQLITLHLVGPNDEDVKCVKMEDPEALSKAKQKSDQGGSKGNVAYRDLTGDMSFSLIID